MSRISRRSIGAELCESQGLSPATRARDLTVKRGVYEPRGVRCYLISEPDGGRSSLLRPGESGRYAALPARGRHVIDLCRDGRLALDLGR